VTSAPSCERSGLPRRRCERSERERRRDDGIVVVSERSLPMAEDKDKDMTVAELKMAIDERFTAIDERFTTVDERFTGVEKRLDKVEVDMEEIKDKVQLIAEGHLATQRLVNLRADEVIAHMNELLLPITTAVQSHSSVIRHHRLTDGADE
jgi:hypothetical protein